MAQLVANHRLFCSSTSRCVCHLQPLNLKLIMAVSSNLKHEKGIIQWCVQCAH